MDIFSVWAEVDLDAVSHNCRVVKNMISPGTRFMAVVKADGYGHGAVSVSRVALREGADFLGVARFEEAIELREGGIDAPILILGYVPYSCITDILRYDFRVTIYSKEQARIFSEISSKNREKIKCHLKVDTGMGRLGFLAVSQEDLKRTLKEISEIKGLPGLDLEGIYTHFAKADTDREFTEIQLNRFFSLLKELKKREILFRIKHAANSAAIISFPHSHLDMVRAGIMLYGVYPSEESRVKVNLKPAMTLKSRVAMVKMVDKGFKVSYGSTYTTSNPTKLATISIGYGDGYPRFLSSKGFMFIGDRKVKVVGRVCMDYTVVDVGDMDVSVGDEVIVFGKGGVSVDEVAFLCNTIGYEVLTGITKRVKRIYKEKAD